jgi:hypothetical protein
MTLATKDNKIIDFIAAIASGLAVSYYTQSMVAFLKPLWSTSDDFKALALYTSATAVTALLMLQWNNRFRVKYGWILIAIIGAILCALTDEFILTRDDPDGVLQGQSLLPIGVVIYSFVTLPVMALVHYLGLIARSRLSKR